MTKSVLVVDDEMPIAFALEKLMQSEGYEVKTADTGTMALSQASHDHPDVILLDLSLPDRNGYEVCQSLRAGRETCGCKIIMMSALGREIEIEKGLAVGADAYLTKPFSLEMVARTVKEILAGT